MPYTATKHRFDKAQKYLAWFASTPAELREQLGADVIAEWREKSGAVYGRWVLDGRPLDDPSRPQLIHPRHSVPPQPHNEASKPEELPNPLEPFVRDKDGLYKVVDGVAIKFHKYDLYPVRLSYDHESVVIRHWLPHNGWMEFSIRSALLKSPIKCRMALMDNSVQPIIGNMMAEYLRAYIKESQARAALRQKSTNHGNWPSAPTLANSFR